MTWQICYLPGAERTVAGGVPEVETPGNGEEGDSLALGATGHGELPSDAGQNTQGGGEDGKQQGGGFLQTR